MARIMPPARGRIVVYTSPGLDIMLAVAYRDDVAKARTLVRNLAVIGAAPAGYFPTAIGPRNENWGLLWTDLVRDGRI